MKIRSLLLGSVAAAGLSTGAFATDLGVETSLDVCDALGLSGLTISSDTNCLVITGEVDFAFSWGDYDSDSDVSADNEINGNDPIVFIDPTGGSADHDVTVSGYLQFKATADSDFGPASATIKLAFNANSASNNVNINEAWVGIGDTTMIMAGLKGSIFNSDDDEPLNWLGLFNSDIVDAGVGAAFGGPNSAWPVETGGVVLQVVHDMGNGLSIGAGLEDLANNGTAVGVLAYASDTMSAHVSFAADDIFSGSLDDWMVHSGFTGTFDTVKVVGALAFDSASYWNALGSASVTFDTITLAGSVEADGAPGFNTQFGVGGSITAAIDDGVSVSVGGRAWQEEDTDLVYQVAAGVTADVSEGLSATAEVGYAAEPGAELFYGKGELTWAPGGGFSATASAEANTLGAFKLGTTMSKTIE